MYGVFIATGNCRFIAKSPVDSSVLALTEVLLAGSGAAGGGTAASDARFAARLSLPEALEAILGKPAASEPVSVDKYYLAGEPPEVDIRDVESKLNVEEMARSASNTGNVKFAGFLIEEKPALRAWHALLRGLGYGIRPVADEHARDSFSALLNATERTLPTPTVWRCRYSTL